MQVCSGVAGGTPAGNLLFVRVASTHDGLCGSLEGKARPADIDGLTPEQQFFIAWGQFRGDEIRPEAQRLMVQGDPHPIAKYRVIGPLSNLPDFQTAWSCKADAATVRLEGKRCDVW